MVWEIGGWLFRHRTMIPVPLIATLLLIPGEQPSPWLSGLGVGCVAAGELVRLWGVRHIGAISRTRSDRLGSLVASGPFAYVRNPLYLGNVVIWVGFTVSAGLLWLVPLVVVALGFEYHAIVRWEERLLESRLGDRYREYSARVPRWTPSLRRRAPISPDGAFSWGDTHYSERGTLLAIAAGYLLLWIKSQV